MASMQRTMARAMYRADNPQPNARRRARAEWREQLAKARGASPEDRKALDLDGVEPLEKPKPMMRLPDDHQRRETGRMRRFLAALFGRRGR